MNPDSVFIFDAALALPSDLRSDLAAKLIDSLYAESPPAPDRSPEDWDAVIKSRSDALNRGEVELIDGEVAIAMLREIVNRAKKKP